MQIYFAIPPNSAFHGLLEEFFFLYQRYKISNTLAINLLGNAQHFRTVPTLIIQKMPLWEERFPAFSWCKSLGKDWYLPAIKEVELFTQQHFHNDSYNIERYWSSTEKHSCPFTERLEEKSLS